jgi:hypothetical protein
VAAALYVALVAVQAAHLQELAVAMVVQAAQQTVLVQMARAVAVQVDILELVGVVQTRDNLLKHHQPQVLAVLAAAVDEALLRRVVHLIMPVAAAAVLVFLDLGLMELLAQIHL